MKRYPTSLGINIFFFILLLYFVNSINETWSDLKNGITGSGLIILAFMYAIIGVFLSISLLIFPIFGGGILINDEKIMEKFYNKERSYRWKDVHYIKVKNFAILKAEEVISGNIFKAKTVDNEKYGFLQKVIYIFFHNIFLLLLGSNRIYLYSKEDYEKKDKMGFGINRLISNHHEIMRIAFEKTKDNPGIEIDPEVYQILEKYEQRRVKTRIM